MLVVAGVLSVGLAAAGIFIPLLPTTPFLLLAAACFMRSSERLHAWLIAHTWFGPYIRNYREHKAATRRVKTATILLLWAALGYAAIWVAEAAALRALLLAVGAAVTVHVLKLKTLPVERQRANEGSSTSPPGGTDHG